MTSLFLAQLKLKLKVVKPLKVRIKLKWYERVLHPFTPYKEEWIEAIKDGLVLHDAVQDVVYMNEKTYQQLISVIDQL